MVSKRKSKALNNRFRQSFSAASRSNASFIWRLNFFYDEGGFSDGKANDCSNG